MMRAKLFHSCTECLFQYLPATLSHPKAVKWHADICVVLQVWESWQIFRIIRNQKHNLEKETSALQLWRFGQAYYRILDYTTKQVIVT